MRQRVALPKEEKNERLFRLEDRACPSEQGMLRRCLPGFRYSPPYAPRLWHPPTRFKYRPTRLEANENYLSKRLKLNAGSLRLQHTVQIQLRIGIVLLDDLKSALLCQTLHFFRCNQMAIAIPHATALPRQQRIAGFQRTFVQTDV